MADLFCRFLYFRSHTTNHNLPLFLPPNRHHTSPLHPHISRITTIKRSSPRLLLLFKPSPFTPSASGIDIISTHENSDGTFLFRFGDPSEIRENVEMEESKAVKEEIEGEDKIGSSEVEVDDDTAVTEVIESADLIDSSSISNTVSAVVGEGELSEKLLEGSDDVELPLLTSSEETGGISDLDLDRDHIENVESLNDEFKDSSPVGATVPDESLQIENVVTEVEMSYEESREETSNVSSLYEERESTSIPGVVVGQQTVNVEECVNQEDDDSPANESTVDQSFEVVDNISAVALSEKESDGITSADVEPDQTVKVEECVHQEDDDSPVNESMLDQSSMVVDNISTVALSKKENDDITSADVEADQTGKVEECLIQEKEDSWADESMLDQSSEVVDNISAVVYLEKESGDITYSAGVEADQTGKVEESLIQKDNGSPADESIIDQCSEVADNISTVISSEKESDDITSTVDVEAYQTAKVEESLIQKDEDYPADKSNIDQSSEVADNISTVALLEKENDDITSADVELDQTVKVEDSPVDESMPDQSSEVVDNISTVALSEKESDDITSADCEADPTGKVEEFLNQGDEDSLADESMLDQSSEVVDNFRTVPLSEKESDDIISADVELDHTGKAEECLNQEDVVSPVDESMLDQITEVVDNSSTVSMSEKESDEITSADIEAHQNGKLEEILNRDEEDSPVDTALFDKSAELVPVVAFLEKETEGITSISDIEIEPTGNVEEGKEYEESPVDTSELDKKSDLLNTITKAASLEKETVDITSAPDIDIRYTGNVEQGLDEVDEEPSSEEQGLDEVHGEPSAVEQDLDVVDEELSAVEQGLDEVHEEPSAVEQGLDEVHEEPSAVEQGLDEVHEEPSAVEQALDEVHEEPSAVDAFGHDKIPVVDSKITARDFLGKETADATTLVALKTDPVVSMLDTDANKGSLESDVTTNVALISEAQNEETVIQDEIIGYGRESLDDNLVSPSPQLELDPATSLYKETEEPNFQTLTTEQSSETDVTNVNALEVQNVLGNNDESDIYGAEVESPKTGPAKILSIGSEEQASRSRSGVPNETVGYVSENDMIQLLMVPPQLEADSMLEEEIGSDTVKEPREDEASVNQRVGRDLVEASVQEVTVSESAESTITSQEMLVTDFVLSSGAALLPHPSKVLTGGEDAYFIAGQTWLGVADGVSQWSLEGTLPGVHAQELVENCEKIVSDCNGNSINNPIELLNLSIAQTHSPGFSTVLIAKFDGQALHVANVGDSGFIVLRHGAVYKRSSPMHHAFSLPVHIERGDDPSSLAQFYRVDLEEEDVIIVATDGLLDNLYAQEVLLITMKSLSDNKSLEEIAKLLAKKAQEVGSSASVRSPFADDAQATGFPGYTGGKLDDVAVIVSMVQRR